MSTPDRWDYSRAASSKPGAPAADVLRAAAGSTDTSPTSSPAAGVAFAVGSPAKAKRDANRAAGSGGGTGGGGGSGSSGSKAKLQSPFSVRELARLPKSHIPLRKDPRHYAATSASGHTPYTLTPSERALLASPDIHAADAPGARWSVQGVQSRRPRAKRATEPLEPPQPDLEVEAAKRAMQESLARAAATAPGNGEPSEFMSSVIARVQQLALTAANAAAAGATGASHTQPHTTVGAYAQQSASAAATATAAAPPHSTHAAPALSLDALSHFLTPEQAAQLHLYPQLLVQAAAAAAQAAALAASSDVSGGSAPGGGLSSSASAPSLHARRDAAPSAPSFQHRTASGQGWDDSFARAPSPRLHLPPRERGTFGAPPALVFPGSPGAPKPKLSPWAQAQREERRAARERERSPSPTRGGTKNAALLSGSPPQHSQAPPATLPPLDAFASPLPRPRLPAPSAAWEDKSSGAGHSSTPGYLAPTASHPHTLSPLPARPSPHPSAGGSRSPHHPAIAPGVKSDLAQALLDLASQFDSASSVERAQLHQVSSMASMALAAITAPHSNGDESAATASASTSQLQTHFDMNPYIASALAPWLASFSASREPYHLSPAALALDSNAAVHPLEHKPAPPPVLYTSEVGLSLSNHALGVGDLSLPSVESLEAELTANTLQENHWHLPPFALPRHTVAGGAGNDAASTHEAQQQEEVVDMAMFSPDPSVLASRSARFLPPHEESSHTQVALYDASATLVGRHAPQQPVASAIAPAAAAGARRAPISVDEANRGLSRVAGEAPRPRPTLAAPQKQSSTGMAPSMSIASPTSSSLPLPAPTRLETRSPTAAALGLTDAELDAMRSLEAERLAAMLPAQDLPAAYARFQARQAELDAAAREAQQQVAAAVAASSTPLTREQQDALLMQAMQQVLSGKTATRPPPAQRAASSARRSRPASGFGASRTRTPELLNSSSTMLSPGQTGYSPRVTTAGSDPFFEAAASSASATGIHRGLRRPWSGRTTSSRPSTASGDRPASASAMKSVQEEKTPVMATSEPPAAGHTLAAQSAAQPAVALAAESSPTASPPIASSLASSTPSPLLTPDEAATKVQSLYRGHRVRAQLKRMPPDAGEAAPAVAAGNGQGEVEGEEEESYSEDDETQEENRQVAEHEAAAVIEEEEQYSEATSSIAESATDDTIEEEAEAAAAPPSSSVVTEEQAAIKIQSLYRGYAVRREIRQALEEAGYFEDNDFEPQDEPIEE